MSELAMDYPLSITKEEIAQLPLYIYSGEVTVIDDPKAVPQAVEMLKKEKVLGFDTETRAAFKKGESYDVSLLQLGTDKYAFLFRLNKVKLGVELASLLEDPAIVKAGIAVRDDIKGLQKLFPFKANNFIDLADVARKKQMKNFGLRALTGIFLRKRLSKKEKISNWDRAELTQGQVAYAACDAGVGFLIFKALCS
jgi:ribonuclease D